jgi:hypothetical protein
MDLKLFFAFWIISGLIPACAHAIEVWKDTSKSTATIGASVFVLCFLGPLTWVIILTAKIDEWRGYRW